MTPVSTRPTSRATFAPRSMAPGTSSCSIHRTRCVLSWRRSGRSCRTWRPGPWSSSSTSGGPRCRASARWSRFGNAASGRRCSRFSRWRTDDAGRGLSGLVRPDDERAPRRGASRIGPVRSARRGRAEQPEEGAAVRDRRAGRAHRALCRRSRAACQRRRLRRADRRVRAAARRRVHRAGPSRRQRFRGRAADGTHEPKAGSRDRHDLPDDRARVRLRELLADEGGGALWRRHLADGAAAGRRSPGEPIGRRGARIIPAKEGQATDIIFLVERLESLIAAGKKLPLTNNVVLDQATILELVDQLRVSVPDEVRQERRITEEAGRITERAREEGDTIVARAQEQAAQMLEERELVRAAQQRAGEIIEAAQGEAREVRRGADEYAAGVLIRLEGECIKALTSIKRGIDMLDERHRPADTDGNARS